MPHVITDRQLDAACNDIAEDIFYFSKRENIDPDAPWTFDPEDYRDEMMDAAHEAADGHQWVIYTSYALSICAHCNTDAGEEFIQDAGLPAPFSLASVASSIAYGEMRARVELALSRLCAEYEAPEAPELATGDPAPADPELA